MSATTTAAYELRFASLRPEGCALSFPCDAAGRVDLDTLGERALVSYLYARTTIGHDFARPCVQAQALH
jgi:hypothetical protein